MYFDRSGTVPAQYSEYRDTNHDDDEDELMTTPSPVEEDFDMLPQYSLADTTTNSSKTSRRPLNYKFSRSDIPKLRNIDLDRVQMTSVVQQPNAIPRDFHYPAERHYRELVNRHRQLDNVRVPIVAPKRKFLGYDAQELLLNGALNCSPCRASDLTYSPTLTIFREENFQDTPQSVFEVLKPALALAERIMLQGHPKFWVDLACGLRVPDYARIENDGSRAEVLFPVADVTQEMRDTTFAKLQALGKRLVIRFERMQNVYGCCAHPIVLPVHRPLSGYLSRGELWPSNERFLFGPPHPSDPWDQTAVIKLDSKFFAAAKQFSMQKFPDLAAKLRFTFFFAVNLLHELAHAFEAKCGHGEYYDLISQDRSKPGALSRSYYPRFSEASYKCHDLEMGAAFEYETFGGRIHPINHDFNMNYGLNVYLGGANSYYSIQGLKALRDGQPFGRAIPMGYIEELHQQSYWDKGPDQNGVLIPLGGPESFILNTTSTLDWREHLLESDASHGVTVLEQAFEEHTHISKRAKTEPPAKSSAKAANSKPRRRLLQTKLRKYPKKADAAAAQIKADLIAQATLEEAELKANELEETTIAKAARDYQPPSPNQPAIDEKFHYVDSEDHIKYRPLGPHLDPASDLYDPLLKLPHELTINDKWLLLEDYALLMHGWESLTFLTKRAAMATTILPLHGLEPLQKNFIPSHDPENWGDVHCGMLRVLREQKPGKGLIVERARKYAEKEQKKEMWRIKAEMEELVVRKGGSRVEWMRGELDLGLLGLEGMSVGTFDETWRGELMKLREEEKRNALGEPIPPKVGETEEGKVVSEEHGKKITDYFIKAEGEEVEGKDDVKAPESRVENSG